MLGGTGILAWCMSPFGTVRPKFLNSYGSELCTINLQSRVLANHTMFAAVAFTVVVETTVCIYSC